MPGWLDSGCRPMASRTARPPCLARCERSTAVVARMAAELELDPRAALAALTAADMVHTDPATGMVSVAYPFSGRITLHRVALAGGPTVQAMCALDALGIP